jgi:Mn-dependent DtxR family transcriptional regulator
LTEKGLEKAPNVKRRYSLLKSFFIRILGVDTLTASEDACRIEHVISQISFEKLREHMREMVEK